MNVPIRTKASCQVKIDCVQPVHLSRKRFVDIQSNIGDRMCGSVVIAANLPHLSATEQFTFARVVMTAIVREYAIKGEEVPVLLRWNQFHAKVHRSVPIPNVKGRTVISMVHLRHVNMFTTALFVFHLPLELVCSRNLDREISS